MQITTKSGIVVTITDPARPDAKHAYTVSGCKYLAYNCDLAELIDHINKLGLLAYENQSDELVGKCLEILEDAHQDRTHDWNSTPTVNLQQGEK